MELFKNPSIDWLGKRWIFIGISVLLAAAGTVSIIAKGGLNLGVDFTGGTLVYVKFKDRPDLDRVRKALSSGGLKAEEVTDYDVAEKNEIQIRMARMAQAKDEALTSESRALAEILHKEFDQSQGAANQQDLNNLAKGSLSARLQELDPAKIRQQRSITEFANYYDDLAGRIVEHRTSQGGLIRSFSEIERLGLPAPVVSALKENFYLGSFTMLSIETVGPKVGAELRDRARNAIIFSLLGMLVYIAFRFRGLVPAGPVYGLAAVIALFHDVFITLGIFSMTGKEISLTVVAALLTLVGYSINDTIVIFDRVRENQRATRRRDLASIINLSINQTLNRTILTSGMTFLAVFALYWFGGEVLNGFSFALVIGIIIGSYSTLAIASPIVLWWQTYSEKRRVRA